MENRILFWVCYIYIPLNFLVSCLEDEQRLDRNNRRRCPPGRVVCSGDSCIVPNCVRDEEGELDVAAFWHYSCRICSGGRLLQKQLSMC